MMNTSPQDRVRRVLDTIERKKRDLQNSPEKERQELIEQLRETNRFLGEDLDDTTIEKAVDEILEQEKIERAEQEETARIKAERAKIISRIPGWGWALIGMASLVLVVPIARLLFRLVEILIRAVI